MSGRALLRVGLTSHSATNAISPTSPAAALLLVALTSVEAEALKIPAFARKYGISCQVCHGPSRA